MAAIRNTPREHIAYAGEAKVLCGRSRKSGSLWVTEVRPDTALPVSSHGYCNRCWEKWQKEQGPRELTTYWDKMEERYSPGGEEDLARAIPVRPSRPQPRVKKQVSLREIKDSMGRYVRDERLQNPELTLDDIVTAFYNAVTE